MFFPSDAFVSDNTEVYNSLFTLPELEDAINSAGNTSVGPDRLHYNFFRNLPQYFVEYILTVFNGLWTRHIFPDAWKEAIVIPIPKPGKNSQDPLSYRPISLTSCLSKLLERMVVKRLSWILDENHILSKFQSGFRKRHSTMDHLIRLETDIRKGFKHKKFTTAVFLDISRAYDMVFKPALIYKLHKLGFKGHLAYYLKGFLSGSRRFQVRCRSMFSATNDLQNGLPQGSCISPILFNIMINDLFDNISPSISYSLFADDSAIWCSDYDPKHSIPRLQVALNQIHKWSEENGFIFSAPKSVAVIFTKNNIPQQCQPLRLSHNVIPYQSSFKFLGVILDRRLSMREHIKYVKTKCSRRLNLFRCISGTDFGADRKTLLHLYKSLIRPVIEYGSIVYAGASESSLAKLETIQNTFIRIALGVMKTSPVFALQVESMIPPLHYRRMEQTLRYKSKIEFLPDHNSFEAIHTLPRIHHNYVGPAEKRSGLTFASRVNKFCGDIELDMPNVSPLPKLSTPPWHLAKRHIHYLFSCPKSSISTAEIQDRFNYLQSKYSTTPFIFIDGSKDQDHTADAMVCGRHLDLARLPDGTSVFLAELHAIYLALKFIEAKRLRHAVICSDSKSAIQSLLTPYPSSPLLTLILNKHEQLQERGAKIQFLWIPGHSGIKGNEKADAVAKDALNLAFVTELHIEFSSIKTLIRKAILKYWQDQWTNSAPQTQLKNIKPVVKEWPTSYRGNRIQEKVLAKIRIGHTYLTHKFIYSKDPRPRCIPCGHVLTVKHILIYCQKYEQHRRPLREYCRRNQLDFSLAVIAGDEHPDLLELLFTFLRNSQIIDEL